MVSAFVDAIMLFSGTLDQQGSSWTRMGFIGWGFLLGASVSATLGISVVLNGASTSPYHSVYVSNLCHAVAGMMLSPNFMCGEPLRQPTQWWSLMGGVLSVPSFISISVGQRFGVQAVLLTQDAGGLVTALMLDSAKPTTPIHQVWTWGGMLLVLLGAFTDVRAAAAHTDRFYAQGSVFFIPTAPVYFVAVFFCGVGYALQAKCNGRLAQEVGSSSRAACICLLFSVLFSIPVMCAVRAAGVQLSIDVSNWPLVLCGALQNLFYIGSMTVIPDRIGYGVTYLVCFLGKVLLGALVDSLGLAGTRVPFSTSRAFSLVLIIIGFALYLTGREAEANSEHHTQLDLEMKAERADVQETRDEPVAMLAPSACLLPINNVAHCGAQIPVHGEYTFRPCGRSPSHSAREIPERI